MTVAERPRAAGDPDDCRMTVGEHLEELRRRMLLALAGMGIALALCLFFGREVMSAFCAPLIRALLASGVNPQVYFTGVGDAFVVFIKISLISAAVVAAPWMVYQFWLFVAAGLYPAERRLVTRYVPLSLALLVSGVLFVYFLVLPWTLKFFLAFSITIPLPQDHVALPAAPEVAPGAIAQLDGDPPEPLEGQIWLNRSEGRIKVFVDGRVRVVPFGPENLAAPMITLPDYIRLVFGMLLTFALSFQLPLAVLALAGAGIVEIEQLRAGRRYVYFAMAVAAAVITPGDVITATVALMAPLIGLYELGVWLAARGVARARPEARA